MDIISVKEYLGDSWTAVSKRIACSLDSDIELLNTTNRSILSHSGKQLRPVLALLFARACSGEIVPEATIRYAAAAELLTMRPFCMTMSPMTATSVEVCRR